MKKLSIIIPVFNEINTIEEIVKRVCNAKTPEYQKELIVIDDNSKDGTGKILKKLQKRYHFILLKHASNKGKGAGIKTGLKYAKGELTLTQDADLEYDPADYKNLLNAHTSRRPVVYGSRNLGTTNRGYLLTHLTGRTLSFIFNLLYGTKITDINTGYKLFRTDILKKCNLQVDGFDFCHEVTAKVLKMGYKIREVPISYYPRTWKEGKKVRPKDAWLDLWTTIKYRFMT